MNSKVIDDELLSALIDAASGGSMQAFQTIVRSYQYYIYTIAFRVLAHDDEAKEVTQECFIRIWKNIGKFNKKVKFTTWIYKIAVNLCYDRLRQRKIENERFDRADFELICGNEDPEQVLTNKEQIEIITGICKGLPAKQRMVFVLRDLEDLAAGEVAKILEISVDSVKANLSIARKAIRTKLIKWRIHDGL
jgi:RNA polymerase sigma-70 factor, ECF subfamily